MNASFLSDSNKAYCENFIKSFFSCVENQYKKMLFSPKFYSDLLLAISDTNFCSLMPDAEGAGYDLCRGIKQELETIGIYKNKIGMIGGLGEKAFAVNLYSKNTGNLKKYSCSLNDLLLDLAFEGYEQIGNINFKTKAKNYDLISGFSGILYYLLDLEWTFEDVIKIKKMLQYLVDLTEKYEYKGVMIPGFRIYKEGIPLEENRMKYPDGYLNFGISHGMIGPLIALAKAKFKGYAVSGMDYAIQTIFDTYETFEKLDEGVLIWPNFLSPKDFYFQNTKANYGIKRASWCYGNVGIMRGLYVAARYISNKDVQKKHMFRLIETLDRPVEKYRLSESCLCHGYSSVISISAYSYYDTKDIRLVKNIDKALSLCMKNLPSDISTEHDFSFLQGISGVVLTLVNLLYGNLDYGNLLMIK